MKILDTNLTFAVRCAGCGRIKFHSISTFKLPMNRNVELFCECGSREVIINLKDNKSITVDMPCLACDINHTYNYSLKQIFKRKVTIICCNSTGLELCFLGNDREVRNIVSRYQEGLNTLLGELGLFQDMEEDILKSIINRIP